MALAGLGAAGLMSNKGAEQVKADAPNTWMVRFQLNLGDCSPSDPENSCFPEDKPVDGVKFHYWGNNVDQWTSAEYMYYSAFDFYAINVSLRDDQTINGCQWILEQRNEGDKYSVDITKFGADDVNTLDKDTDIAGIQYQCYCSNTWIGDKWQFVSDRGYATKYIKAEVGVGEYTYYNFEKDPTHNRFVADNVNFPSDEAIGFNTENNFELSSNAKALLDEKSEEFMYGGTNNWWYMNKGQYDFILENATLKIRKIVNEYVGVYLVGVDADVRVYTFGEGGIEEFGTFPGTRLGDVVGAQEVTGDLQFQGNDLDLWYLPLNYGYPNADHIILSYVNEYGYVGTQTKNMLLVEGSAYWFTYEEEYHNDDAGLALQFLLDVEEKRLDATDDSVCNISKSDAAAIVNAYNGLSSTIRETYIDSTTVNTLRRDGEEGKEYVSYRLVIEELAKIAEISLVGANRVNTLKANVPTIIVVVSAMIVVSAGLVTVLVFKRRKHE